MWSPSIGHVSLHGFLLPLAFWLGQHWAVCICVCTVCMGGGIWTHTTIKKGKDKMKEKDKTIQRTGLFTLRPPLERLKSVPPQCITIQHNMQKFVNLEEPPDAAEEEERARRDLPGPSRGVWASYEWRLENFKGRGQISVQRATRALWERTLTCTCSWQGRKRATTLSHKEQKSLKVPGK